MSYWFDSESNSFFLNERENLSFIPQLVWVITDKCNYHCPFCFQPKTNTEVALKDLDTYIDLFHKLGIQKIDISGGEPLFFKSLSKFVDTLKANGFYITISTNGSGTTLNRNWIASNSELFSRMLVSLNGSNADLNDLLCGSRGAFNRFMSFIELLKAYNCKNLRINTVISSIYLDNSSLFDMINLIKQLSPCEWCLIQPHPENKLPTFDEFSISSLQFSEIVNIASEELKDTNINVIYRNVENYAGYWVLNPDGHIFLHTDGIRESIGTCLNVDNIPRIISLSQKYGLWVPIKSNSRR